MEKSLQTIYNNTPTEEAFISILDAKDVVRFHGSGTTRVGVMVACKKSLFAFGDHAPTGKGYIRLITLNRKALSVFGGVKWN